VENQGGLLHDPVGVAKQAKIPHPEYRDKGFFLVAEGALKNGCQFDKSNFT
jgi:hypothetical protein